MAALDAARAWHMAVAADFAVAAGETRPDAADFALMFEELADAVGVVGVRILVRFHLAVYAVVVDRFTGDLGARIMLTEVGKPIVFLDLTRGADRRRQGPGPQYLTTRRQPRAPE